MRATLRVHATRTPLAGLLSLMLATAAGCGDPSGLISRSIFTQAAHGPGARVQIVELMPFAFERMWIFPADASAQSIREALGTAAEELPDERLAARGDSALLVFVRGSRVVIVVPHPPTRGRFHEETFFRGIPADDAVFAVDSASPPGRPILRNAGAASPP